MVDNADTAAVEVGIHVSILRKDVTGTVVGTGTVGRKKVWLIELDQEVTDGKLKHSVVAVIPSNVHATEGTQEPVPGHPEMYPHGRCPVCGWGVNWAAQCMNEDCQEYVPGADKEE